MRTSRECVQARHYHVSTTSATFRPTIQRVVAVSSLLAAHSTARRCAFRRRSCKRLAFQGRKYFCMGTDALDDEKIACQQKGKVCLQQMFSFKGTFTSRQRCACAAVRISATKILWMWCQSTPNQRVHIRLVLLLEIEAVCQRLPSTVTPAAGFWDRGLIDSAEHNGGSVQ